MKWFSIAGIRAEVHRIRWPKMKDLIANSGSVIFFTAAFALFLLCANGSQKRICTSSDFRRNAL